MFRKSLMLCAASLLFAGCDPAATKEDEFREGLPSKEQVNVKEPGGSTAQGLETNEVHAYSQGQTSDFYKLTRGATVSVNGGTAFVLNLLDQVTKNTPTSLSGDVAVWGPYTDALSPTTWKLTVTQTGDNTYSYKLEGKAKAAADSDFKVIISGTHAIATDAAGNRVKAFGSGDITLDWDAAQTLPEHGNDIGTAQIRYSRPDAQSVATVEAHFRNVKDDDRPGTKVNADYGYKETPGAGGEFDFALDKNLDNDAARSLIEHLTVKSRWVQSGAGRSDVKITGGDVGVGEATINECWDANFSSQFLVTNLFPLAGYGNLTACGSFSTAVYSGL